jgi:geranylgeranyl diphosphate synthase type II
MQDVQQGQDGGDSAVTGRNPAAGRARSADPTMEAQAWLAEQAQCVNAGISTHLNALKQRFQPHSRLLDAVEYSLAAGGKRLRPVLVLETCRVCGGSLESAWPAALAIECIHAFSLIHDDLPAMDDDDLRRGKPTCHKVFGEALAVLAGDWLVAHAFELLTLGAVAPHVAPALVRALAEATGDMVVGQAADIAGERQPADPELVRFIHQHKTARLLECACRLGALTAQASTEKTEALAEYGRRVGLAFQISDDLLDRTGTTENLGKRVGKDAGESKQTYPAAFGIKESHRQARQEIEGAVAALKPFGPEAAQLKALAWYVIQRNR